MENLHCNFHSVENSNCIYHIVENITQYIPYCGNNQGFYHKFFFKYVTVKVLLAFFPFSTLCMEFLPCTLHIVEHKLFYFQLFWKVYIVISTLRKIQIVLTTLWKISKGAFHIVEILNAYSLEHLFHMSSFEPTD